MIGSTNGEHRYIINEQGKAKVKGIRRWSLGIEPGTVDHLAPGRDN